MQFWNFCRVAETLTEVHILYEALSCLMHDVLRPTLLHVNKTTNDYITSTQGEITRCYNNV